jgi:hypothetical protein
MAAVTRLVTFVDVDDGQPGSGIAASARHEAELDDGGRVVLLGGRGWSESRDWDSASIADLADTARMVVGPDEPIGGRSHEEEADAHWTYLGDVLRRNGVEIDAAELRQLPHIVEFSPQALACIPGA